MYAPSYSGGVQAMRMPGAEQRLPAVDDSLAPPETRVEYLNGIELFAAPALAPHAVQHADLSYVLRAHTPRGYRSAVDLLTRTGESSDFAPDASIFAEAPDPVTGGRRLEELAFEIADKQAMSVPTDKARALIARGVRRVFCVVVKWGRLLEWSRATDGWQTLAQDAVIEDPVLVRPLPVRAILDAAEGDAAVVRALLARQEPALLALLEQKREDGVALGKAEALRDAIRSVLRARGLLLSPDGEDALQTCSAPERLQRWLTQAVTAPTAAEALALEGDGAA